MPACIVPRVVTVMPDLPTVIPVAVVVPKFKLAAESTVKLPAVVDNVEAAPPVSVNEPPEVNEDAPDGVKLTEPAPAAVKLPEAKFNAISAEPAVIIVAP